MCGDGLIFAAECDDNNTEDEDGCSSSCTVESDYECDSGSPSQCTYTGQLTIQLTSINRQDSANTGVFVFTLSPDVPRLQEMNFSQYVVFTVGGRLE